MQLDRIDLCDIRQPGSLAKAVLGQMGELTPPIPVEEIAIGLDITEIRKDRFDGFEGMLLTDIRRSRGSILANTSRGMRRARFTIAHELGHFLMEHHVLSDEAGFTCRVRDMREARENRRHQKQESQANRFAIDLLAPFRLVDRYLSDDPDLRDGQRLRDELDISLEACVRRMIDRRYEPLAAVWSADAQVRYVHRATSFPFIHLTRGDWLPQTTEAFRAVQNGAPGFTQLMETHAMAWTRKPELELFEQTRVQAHGHAVTLLWACVPEDDDDDEDPYHRELGMPKFR